MVGRGCSFTIPGYFIYPGEATFCPDKKCWIKISMDDYDPTIFFILENEELGTWWIGQTKMRLDNDGFQTCRPVTQNELIAKLEAKYETHHEYTDPSLDLRLLNKQGNACYGVERWLSQLEYEIKREPKKYKDLKKLLTAGWNDEDFTTNSTLHVLHIYNRPDPLGRPKKLTNVREMYADLKKNWGTPGKGLRSFYKLKKCLNERVGKSKDVYLYEKGRAKVIRQMKMNKRHPKQSTIDKYNLIPEEMDF
jgi:hypothetical protein